MSLASSAPASRRTSASVRVRLLGGFSLVILLLVGLAVIASQALSVVHSHESRLAKHAVVYLNSLNDAALAAKAAANDERGFLLSGEKSFVKESQGRRTTELPSLAQARSVAVTAEERQAVDTISTTLNAFNAQIDKEFAGYASNKAGVIATALGSDRDLRKKYEDSFTKAIKLADAQVTADDKAATSAASQENAVVWTILATAIALAACIAWLLARSISRPLARTIAVLETSTQGDLTARIPDVGAPEFRRLANAGNEMLDALGAAMRTISRSTETLTDATERLTDSSSQMASATQRASNQAAVVATAAEQVSRSVKTVAVGAEEMEASVREIAGNAVQASHVAAQAVTAADNANNTVARLGDSSQEIGSVIKVITSIAEQTKLLALNATIEAARAGESGKGFAVVASEVKELAQETARATEGVEHRVSAIQSDIANAVGAINEISAVITQINDLQSMIAAAVEQQTSTTKEMARNLLEAATGTEQIAETITGVADATQETSQRVTISDGAATELARLGAELRDLVGTFKF